MNDLSSHAFYIWKQLLSLSVRNLRKPIEVRLLKEAEEYFFDQNQKVQENFLKIFDKVQLRIKGDWFKKLNKSDGILKSDIETTKNFIEYLVFGTLKRRIH